MEKCGIIFEVWIEFLNVILMSFSFTGLSSNAFYWLQISACVAIQMFHGIP
jgi:hypothetical protein